MVPSETNKRKTLSKYICAGVFLVTFGFILALLFFLNRSVPEPEPEIPAEDIPSLPDEPEEVIKEINFQPLIDEWYNSIGGKKGIVIYDLDLDKVVGAINADTKFQTASLYKLFVVYQGYRLLQSGGWSGDAKAGSTGYTIAECLDLAIRESHSPCAETLWSMLGRDNLDAIVHTDFGLENVYVGSLSATPNEIMKMMKIFYDHTEILNENLVTTMKDSFLNQPPTTYNWRQGLPTGFSTDVLVYNKVGWHWNGSQWAIYDDAAILDFTKYDRHFIVVVMSNYVSHLSIRDFGTKIENLVITELEAEGESSEGV